MANKRHYKTLTKAQTTKVKRYTKQGKSQKVIAKLLGVSKQRVVTAQKKSKIGKRAASPFWKDVKTHRGYGYTHKESIEIVKYLPKWKKAYKKRTGKPRTSAEDKQNIRDMLREYWQNLAEGEDRAKIEFEGETYYDTPK